MTAETARTSTWLALSTLFGVLELESDLKFVAESGEIWIAQVAGSSTLPALAKSCQQYMSFTRSAVVYIMDPLTEAKVTCRLHTITAPPRCMKLKRPETAQLQSQLSHHPLVGRKFCHPSKEVQVSNAWNLSALPDSSKWLDGNRMMDDGRRLEELVPGSNSIKKGNDCDRGGAWIGIASGPEHSCRCWWIYSLGAFKAEFWNPIILHRSNVCSDLCLRNAMISRVKRLMSCKCCKKGFHCRVRIVGRRRISASGVRGTITFYSAPRQAALRQHQTPTHWHLGCPCFEPCPSRTIYGEVMTAVRG